MTYTLLWVVWVKCIFMSSNRWISRKRFSSRRIIFEYLSGIFSCSKPDKNFFEKQTRANILKIDTSDSWAPILFEFFESFESPWVGDKRCSRILSAFLSRLITFVRGTMINYDWLDTVCHMTVNHMTRRKVMWYLTKWLEKVRVTWWRGKDNFFLTTWYCD